MEDMCTRTKQKSLLARARNALIKRSICTRKPVFTVGSESTSKNVCIHRKAKVAELLSLYGLKLPRPQKEEIGGAYEYLRSQQRKTAEQQKKRKKIEKRIKKLTRNKRK